MTYLSPSPQLLTIEAKWLDSGLPTQHYWYFSYILCCGGLSSAFKVKNSILGLHSLNFNTIPQLTPILTTKYISRHWRRSSWRQSNSFNLNNWQNSESWYFDQLSFHGCLWEKLVFSSLTCSKLTWYHFTETISFSPPLTHKNSLNDRGTKVDRSLLSTLAQKCLRI